MQSKSFFCVLCSLTFEVCLFYRIQYSLIMLLYKCILLLIVETSYMTNRLWLNFVHFDSSLWKMKIFERSNHISWLCLLLFRWEWDWKKNFWSQFVLITFASVIPAIFISCCFILGVMFRTSILQVIIRPLRSFLFSNSVAHILITKFMTFIDVQELNR